MAEFWNLVDRNRNIVGVTYERGSSEPIPEGLHHVVEIWTKNSKGEILLTQRHPNKNMGLEWECSGGAVVAGEESIDAAIRELSEETGIHAD